MKVEVRDSLDKVDAEAIVVGVRDGVDAAAAYDARFASIAQPLFASGDLPLKALETFVFPGNPKTIFVGIAKLGDADAWRKIFCIFPCFKLWRVLIIARSTRCAAIS